MLVFDYMFRLYNQDVLVITAPPVVESATESATDCRGSAVVHSAAVGSAHL
jgi:hypothetical protein